MPVVDTIRRSPGRHIPYCAPSTQVKLIPVPVSRDRDRQRHRTVVVLGEPPVYAAATSDPSQVDSTSDTDEPNIPPYPTDVVSRSRFTTVDGKRPSPHAWKVFDLLLGIPPGRVTTYGALAGLLKSSPQAIGQALRGNPFAPEVPCHRVIASTMFIGGYMSDWNDEQAWNEDGTRTKQKMILLQREGVEFDERGYLVDRSRLWP